MHRFLAPVLLALFLHSSVSAAGRPEVSPYLKAYSGGEGVVVWLVRVGPRSANEALVQIVGIDHDLDGRIRRVRGETTNTGIRYVTVDKGEKVLAVEPGSVELFGPVLGGSIKVVYDRTRSEQGSADHFLSTYLDQK